MAELPWKPVIYLPAHLTVRLEAEVLQAEDPGPWCESTAAGLLGPGARRKRVRRLASTLMQYAGMLKSPTGRGPLREAVWLDAASRPGRSVTAHGPAGSHVTGGRADSSRG